MQSAKHAKHTVCQPTNEDSRQLLKIFQLLKQLASDSQHLANDHYHKHAEVLTLSCPAVLGLHLVPIWSAGIIFHFPSAPNHCL